MKKIIISHQWRKFGEVITTAIIECVNAKGQIYYHLYDIYPNDVYDLRSFNAIPTLEEARKALSAVSGIK